VTGGLPPIDSPPTNDNPTGGNPGDGGGKACTVTATNLCGGTPGAVELPGLATPPDQPGGGAPGGVIPEPAGWMTMILGFGALACVLRIRRRRASAALV
jgi:hypothetical protein